MPSLGYQMPVPYGAMQSQMAGFQYANPYSFAFSPDALIANSAMTMAQKDAASGDNTPGPSPAPKVQSAPPNFVPYLGSVPGKLNSPYGGVGYLPLGSPMSVAPGFSSPAAIPPQYPYFMQGMTPANYGMSPWSLQGFLYSQWLEQHQKNLAQNGQAGNSGGTASGKGSGSAKILL